MAYIKALFFLFALVALTLAQEATREKKQIYGAYPAVTAYSAGAAYPYAYNALNAYAGYPYSAYPAAVAAPAVAAPAFYY
ncbi:hypothetical protein J6590_035960 [Homalodisca vitripennis]|nr:hypothetical protein J6590_035960 [Homalodisca vitripennis]